MKCKGKELKEAGKSRVEVGLTSPVEVGLFEVGLMRGVEVKSAVDTVAGFEVA
jgi:hypothetical protein